MEDEEQRSDAVPEPLDAHAPDEPSGGPARHGRDAEEDDHAAFWGEPSGSGRSEAWLREPVGEDPPPAQAPEVTEERPPWRPVPRVRLRILDVVVLLLLLVVAGGTRFVNLDQPGKVLRAAGAPADDVPDDCKNIPLSRTCYELIPLDEKHYVPDARDILQFGTESDKRVSVESGAFVVHPPVGKILIAAGMSVFGDEPFGWRASGALVGTLGVLILYLLALRLWRSPWWAALAGFLLATEGLWLVQSRVAMLDIYVGFFVLLGVWLLVLDRDRGEPGKARPVRIAAALAFGLALATKWSALPFVAAAVLLAIVWEAGKTPRTTRLPRQIGRYAWTLLTFTVLPFVAYVATYASWLNDDQRYVPPVCEEVVGRAKQLWCYHGEMAEFHRNLEKYETAEEEEGATETTGGTASATGTTATGATSATAPIGSAAEDAPTGAAAATESTPEAKMTPGHPYFGHGWTWPWTGRPVVHHYEQSGEGDAERRSEVVGIPNLGTWWPAFFVGFPLCLWWGLRKNGDRNARFVALMFAAGYLPYVAADVIDRPVFMFYATPLVPFLALAVVQVWVRLLDRFPGARTAVIGHVVLVTALFAYFYPVLTGHPISPDGVFGWNARMWISGDCSATDAIKIACWI